MTHVAPLKILKASAGSGKTFSLTLHYITLLLTNENSYREILAVTFTNKATAEMKERILLVLRGLAVGDTSKKIDDYRKPLLQQNSEWSENVIQQKALRVFRKILHDYSHFTISTIDGFSQKVIRSFTYELNLDAAYKIEMNTSKVKADLTRMLNESLDEKPQLLEWIIDFAEKKINNNENWNYRNQLSQLAELIFSENFQEFDGALASADTHRLFNLLNNEIYEKTKSYLDSLSEAIKAFQDMFKALFVDANEMKNKSKNPLVSANNTSSKVHKLSNSDLIKTLDKFIKLIDNNDAFTDQDKNIRYDLKERFKPILEQFVTLKSLLPTFLAYQAVQSNLYYLRLLKEMSDLLSQWRKENNAQLISDSQILLSRLGLDQNQDPTFIWEKIGNRYNYFLFDEFQDTSRSQWKNYSPLLLNALSNAKGQLNEHLIVGDVKQSIYRWRNGDWRILLQQVEEQVMKTFHLSEEQKKHFIDIGSLDVNYRSLPNIIRFNNYLYETIPQQLQQLLNKIADTELSEEGLQWWHASQNDTLLLRAYDSCSQLIPSFKVGDENPQGSIEIEYLTVENSRRRANQVEEESINRLCAKVTEWISSGRYKPKQIGILVRSNKQVLLVIQKLMEHKNTAGLQYEVISGDALSLVNNDAINLLIETLKALVYTSDKHVIHHARMAYLYQIIQNQQSFDGNEWLKFKDNNLHALDNILPTALLSEWDTLQALPLIHLIEKLIELYGFTSPNNVHLPYLLAFKDVVGNFTANGERGINQFLEFWEEDGHKAVIPSAGKIDAIEVTTIHKSKGLAYDVVMIPFCSWSLDGKPNGDFWIDTEDTPFHQLGRIPIKYTSSLGQSLFYKQYFEEKLFNYMDSLNTLYVATTRAVEHIYITAPAFAEKEDKKEGRILDIKNDLISDIVYQVLTKEESPFPLTGYSLSIDNPIPPNAQKEEDHAGTLALTHYPTSRKIEENLEKVNERNINTILLMEKASRYGILAHEVMAEATTESDIPKIIHRYMEEGVLAANDKTELEEQIARIWHHPLINKWLTGGYTIKNEAAIINDEGETLRPDKVFIGEQESIILDFKFTNDNYFKHEKQIKNYMKALQNLGYTNVRGYLFYAKMDDLVEVKL